jgi:hypothetical protein
VTKAVLFEKGRKAVAFNELEGAKAVPFDKARTTRDKRGTRKRLCGIIGT